METVIFGNNSMIGNYIQELTHGFGISHKHYDLIDFDSCRDAFVDSDAGPNTNIFLLSGYNGGLEFNRKYPAEIFYQTAQINLNVLRCCQIYKINRITTVIASCSYPDLGEKVLKEEDLWEGKCHPSVESHGLAKRLLHSYSRQLNKQFGLKTVNTILTNCYGPGDRFNLERTKVVGAVIKRLCDAKLEKTPSVTFFGTGKPLREIMYAEDAAKCLIDISSVYQDYLNPVNIGSDQEISILDLVNTVNEIVGYEGEIKWDTTKPDGQMRKKLCTDKMRGYINPTMTKLKTGLENTIKYYMEKGRFLAR